MNRIAVVWICLALVVTAVGKRGSGIGLKGGFSWGKGSSSKGTSTGSKAGSNTRGSSSGGTHSQPGNYPRQPQPGNYPRQPQPQPGNYPRQPQPQPGNYPHQPQPQPGNYPRQPQPQNPPPYPGTGGGYPGSYPGRGGVGGYPNSFPGRSGGYGNPYPHGGSYPGYPVRGASYPGSSSYGGAAGVGGYPGAAQYPYWNPNNKIISPRYGGNYGYGGYGTGGSPFAQSVQNMGMRPSLQSKGFGKQAVMAAGVGAVAGMALGYGLGSFPRPRFAFHSPQEEYYYNHYMYRRYGTRPSDSNTNPGSPGNQPGDSGLIPGNSETKDAYGIIQNPPPQSYDHFMNSCMKRTDLLREEDRNKRAAENPLDTSDSEMAIGGFDPNGPQGAVSTGTAEAEASESVTGSKNNGEGIQPGNTTRTLPYAGTLTAGIDEPLQNTGQTNEDDEATVSIMEIGYPALIEQLKARQCIRLYMVYAEHHAERQVQDSKSGVEQLRPGFHVISLLLSCTLHLLISSLVLLQV